MICAFLRQRGTAVGVSKGLIPAVTPNGAVGLPRVTPLDALRSSCDPYISRLKNKMNRAQEALTHDCPWSASSAHTGRLE
jgi:hypothetical protein